jgi:SnoaL-like domain
VDRSAVSSWIVKYEEAWRTLGTELLADLFTPDVSYVPSPWAAEISDVASLEAFWEEEREGPDEEFRMMHEVVAIEGNTAVARITVDYVKGGSWRDLWVLEFAGDGRCSRFEEWPFTPGQADGH